MDDLGAGLSNFDVIINSLDSKVSFDTQKAEIRALLNKPLEFTAGIWEVGVKQIIFKSYLKEDPKNPQIKEIFKVLTNFTSLEYFGSINEPIILIDAIPSDKNDSVCSFTYASPTFVTVISSYISSINISFLDINNNPFIYFNSTYPIIIRLIFQRKLTLL